MTTKLLVVSFAVLSFVVTACAADPASDEDVSETEDLITAGVGKVCAGGVVAATCAPGLKCVMRGRIGKCAVDPNAEVNGADENETCGGTQRIVCKAGLYCKKRAGATAAAAGKCAETSPSRTCLAMPSCDDGDSSVASEAQCPQDASCYSRTRCSRKIWCTDGAGPGNGGFGLRCGSGFAGTIRCPAGLRCSATIGLGYCR